MDREDVNMATIDELHRKLQEAEQNLALLQQEKDRIINEKEQKIRKLEQELVSIHTGRSWKLTRPLRRIKRLFVGQ